MRILFALAMVPWLTSCADQPELSCVEFSPVEGPMSNQEMLVFPDEILDASEELFARVSRDPSLVGLSGTFDARCAGTKSYSVANEIAHLKRMMAYQTALEQAAANDGTPLVDVSDERMCELLAASVASIDQGQSSDQFLDNLKTIQMHFGPQYPYRADVRGEE